MRGAADELALTHGAVSRRVAKLSKDLGITLVRRDGRGVALTPSGEKLAQVAQQALGLISDSVTDLRLGDKSAPIVISCERSVAMRWLISRLTWFQDLHPDIPVHLSVGGGRLNFAKDGVTLAIRRMDFPVDPDWSVETVFSESMGPVMQPSMIAAFRSGDYIGLGARTRPEAWSNWLTQQSDIKGPREVRLFDHHFLMAEAAASGLGVAMSPKIVSIDDISRERLVAPCGFASDDTNYGLIYPRSPKLSVDTVTLIKWMKGIFESVH